MAKEPLLHTHFTSSRDLPLLSSLFCAAASRTATKNYFGWNLFTATSNIKLVSCLLLCAFFQKPIHTIFLSARRKPLPSTRITELPNCFFSLSFPPSLRLSSGQRTLHTRASSRKRTSYGACDGKSLTVQALAAVARVNARNVKCMFMRLKQ